MPKQVFITIFKFYKILVEAYFVEDKVGCLLEIISNIRNLKEESEKR